MNHCRLLVLDDDPMIGTTIQLIAETAGAAARLCTDPEEFFAAIQSWQPTHICTDLNMPEMDGMQVLAELARRGCRAQIIVSSGVGQRVLDAAARSGAEQGLAMTGVLPKPFAPATLRQLLQLAPPPSKTPPAAPRADPAYLPDLPALQRALEQGELGVVFQPKLHCASGQLSGLEVLVRWQHPVHGLIGPDRFIPLAEDGGCIDELTLQVLDLALAWFVPWRSARRERSGVTLSVNLSARSLGNPTLVSRLHNRCIAAGLAPGSLVFELTETAAMDKPVLALELLTRLRVQGFQLSIDDFGTGYSSMVQLVRLPFSEVKVDRSFVMTAARSEESRAVIRSIVGLGHSLGLRVTAEGVEDETALSYLREVGCDEAQGYFIARPMADTALEAWIDARVRGGEAERLQALRSLHLMDSAPQARFTRLTALAQRALNVPIAVINLVDDRRHWSLAATGLPGGEVPLERSVCLTVVREDQPLLVADLSADARYAQYPAVIGGLRAYAGVPLRVAGGPPLGALCVVDTVARNFDPRAQAVLEGLAMLVGMEMMADPATIDDELTGLLTRRAFDERADPLLRWSHAAGLDTALLLLNLPPETAPEQLRRRMRALAEHLGGGALLAHHGVQQVAALLPGTDALGVLAAMSRWMADPAPGSPDMASATWGWSVLSGSGQGDLQSLLAEADAMLQRPLVTPQPVPPQPVPPQP